MKKLLTISAIALAVAIPVAGCGSGGTTSTATGPTTAMVQTHVLQYAQANATKNSDAGTTVSVDKVQVLNMRPPNATVSISYTVQSNVYTSIKQSRTVIEHITVDDQGRVTSGTAHGPGTAS